MEYEVYTLLIFILNITSISKKSIEILKIIQLKQQ